MMNQNNSTGLTSAQAQQNLIRFGPNQIFKKTEIKFFQIARQEIVEPMILLLFAVGIIYSLWGKLEDALTIFIVIILLVFAEVYNEFRAKKAIAALEIIAAPKTKVWRDSQITEINSGNVVPGDILILTAGTKVAADAEITESIGLQAEEAALTGESLPVDKPEKAQIFAGTVIVSGEGKAEVTATGSHTKMGKIAARLKVIKPPKTALQLAMKKLSQQLVYVALFFSLAIPALGIIRGQDFKTMILTGLSLSFATIPEELPIIITMVLGLGAYTLSQNKFLVKKIKAAETLGNATVIVTDKTGTITEGKMKIIAVYPPQKEKEAIADAVAAVSEYSLNPLDIEILRRAGELKIKAQAADIVRQRIFGNGKKTKSVIRKINGEYKIFLSGAPEEVFSACSNFRPEVAEVLSQETARGRRVIAVAGKNVSAAEINSDFKVLETGLTFGGLISFEDSPRPGVKDTIARAAIAGIKTLMVTGDHPATAAYVASQVGIISEGEKVITGTEIDILSDIQLQNLVKKISVFARTTPEHKYRIVKALQQNGQVVAVTGDGINDALALKASDIGIAMGIRGTDVAKEAAEVVLADDNYVTIAQGIFEGRKFFDNLQKGIKYYLSVKIALVLIFLLPVLLGIPLPFAPIQIILLELFMDLAASAGFVAEPAEKNIYSRPPRPPREKIFGKKTIADIFLKGFILFFAVTAVYLFARSMSLTFAQTQTAAFAAWIFGHIILAYVSRSESEPLASIGPFTNKIINLWGLAAVAVLLLGIYWPRVGNQFNLSRLNFLYLLAIAVFTAFILSLLEIKKIATKIL